jgi:glycosyltransferase involved in cell wall biosynthesis
LVAQSTVAVNSVAVVIPALDEELSVGATVQAARSFRDVTEVVVADNGSVDRTARCAREAGARVVCEPQHGYGRACQAALRALRVAPPDVVLFMDADGADDPADGNHILAPILDGDMDLVVGSRSRGAEPGALTPQARFGNWLATALLRLLFGVQYTDLGPFRAIRWPALEALRMSDNDFGWTLQMQARAARLGLRTLEIPVKYRRRVGRSKISGTVLGSVRAGYTILWTLAKERLLA